MQIGVSTYSFSSYIKEKNANIFDIIKKAREIGFSSIEFTSLYSPEGKDSVEQAKEIKACCEEAGLQISSYTIGANLLSDPDSEVMRLKGEIKIAAALGAPLMRHDVAWGFPASVKTDRSFDDCIKIVAPACKKINEYASEYGIKTMFENHGQFCQESQRCEKLINSVNSETFGLLLDTGNFLCVDEYPPDAVGRLLPYIFHVHIKDFFIKKGYMPNPGAGWFGTRGGNYLRGTIVGHGEVPVTQSIKMIKNSGYKGNFSIEFEGIEENIFALKTGVENLNNYFPG